jgi:hypothetical protein
MCRRQWTRWGREWERWDHRMDLDLDAVRGLGRPARREKLNGRGAWYEFVPGPAGARGRVVLYAADETALGEVEIDTPGGWCHLRGCGCGFCAARRPRTPLSAPGSFVVPGHG